jgi:hypothetical protein
MGQLRRDAQTLETAGLLAHNDLADGVTADLTVQIPNPLPATMGEIIDAVVLRITGSPVNAIERAAYASFLGVSEAETSANSPLGDAALLGDFVGLTLSRPTFQYR